MKQWIRQATLPLKKRLLAAACLRLEQTTEVQRSAYTDVAALAFAWGNPGYAAGLSYLRDVGERAIQTPGPILECGSGATTLLIGALTARNRTAFVALEHDRNWHEYLSRILDHLGYTHVDLVYAPLRDHGNYLWYEAPNKKIPPEIRLVICDGPPGNTPGGRYGLMPVMGHNLAHNCVILLDDTHRFGERRVVDAWRDHRCLKANRLGAFGSHAEVVCC
jgi:hypothetical protein